MIKKRIYTAYIFIGLMITACNKNDHPDYKAPTISYEKIESEFFKEGNVYPNKLDWGGQTGTIFLEKEIEALSINATDGQLSWGKNLDIGTIQVPIIAKNSAGSTKINISLQNYPAASFAGKINVSNSNDININLIIEKDSIIKIYIQSLGSWAEGKLNIDFKHARLQATVEGKQNTSIGAIPYSLSIDAELVYKQEDFTNEGESRPFIIGYIWDSKSTKKLSFKALKSDQLII
ncbi:hypothetical protein EGM88_07450 [Aureibaculum marinum]|uniref:Uncharacterized protein n=1 Tax=Aureibaculum marinum TaxID=2487930 RepID=A0A3N4P0B6_9FLAO|nr:hypothetical protein [Aureibaculum marinum]RPD97990.1 hypothetical protein EGM88_07450 [Aureibaculum marinum]